MSIVTVGTLLAGIANSIDGGLRILGYADKRQWGPDEHEQVRLLEVALDSAKKDFQELSQLVNGQLYYENDRSSEFSPSPQSFHPVSVGPVPHGQGAARRKDGTALHNRPPVRGMT